MNTLTKRERSKHPVGEAWTQAQRENPYEEFEDVPGKVAAARQEALQVEGWPVCPRCGVAPLEPWGGALSRLDNETEICSNCGTMEAMRDFTGRGPVPPDEWPTGQ